MDLIQTTHKNVSFQESNVLGADLCSDGVNFSLYSKYAKEIFLLLFNRSCGDPTDMIKLQKDKNDIWSIFVRGIKAGQLYGYKVRGDFAPQEGMRFNEHKLLVDPYAKAFYGDFKNKDNLFFGYDVHSNEQDLSFDSRDSTPIAPKSVVIDDTFDWSKDKSPDIPLEKLIIYEVHLKGFTAHKSSGVTDPGTYLGFIDKIPYLKNLGINAVEFLPLMQFHKRDGLERMGLNDYWGYNTLGFFAPENSYSTCQSVSSPVQELKMLIRELHNAGIEIIMDVVYNHTGELDEFGPTLCFRGIDNSSYYALTGKEHDQSYRLYVNDAGCGNTLNVENPPVMRLVLDSLRYWADVMHVDGFRFDLASILPKVRGRYSKESFFFEAIAKDPILKKVKLIAEPWDLTTYQVGNFPLEWSEWNGKFRDNARKFIKGDAHQAKELSFRLTGSADLYGNDGRTPYNSINFITCHDGFTLNDLYLYNDKHNYANGENNADGTNENFSWNCGVEGDTQDEAIVHLRHKMIKNALSCLLIPLGTPLLLGGDEFMRTQKGNNNAYCQDNETTWFDWDYAKRHKHMTTFVKKIIAFRKKHTILQKRKFLAGQSLNFDDINDITWFGYNLDGVNWDDPELKTFCCHLDGNKDTENPENYHLFFILNADFGSHTVKIPEFVGIKWHRAMDTSLKTGDDILDIGKEIELSPQDLYIVNPRSVVGLIGKEFYGISQSYFEKR
ncbi:MAG: glycogen debranching protein GlgX [Candidatus Omnitrophica bacterium]|nr:glycogen debranching protein GlgX [Candidatus Omnitrophota bacterium]